MALMLGQINYAGRPIYFLGTGLFKISMCLTYLTYIKKARREAIQRKLLFGTIAFVIVTSTVFACLNLFGCKPISKSFDRTIPGTCLQYEPVNYVISTFIILEDALCFLFPVWFLISAPKVSIRERDQQRSRLLLIVLSAAGLLTTVVSITRASYINENSNGKGDLTGVVTCSSAELSVGIIMSCLPFFTPIINRVSSRLFPIEKSAHGGTSLNRSADGGGNKDEEELPVLGIERTVEYRVTRDGSTPTEKQPTW
ncbi:Hypothetical protein D9617_53g017720 [Elsinoe fawcettii]|nr:Hypothetical protein D9617_53g017720 [Elsinoe fawcettii]